MRVPPEPQITEPPVAVRAELAALSDAVERSCRPKRPDRNLLIGTWNLRAFGGLTKRWQAEAKDTPKRNFRRAAPSGSRCRRSSSSAKQTR